MVDGIVTESKALLFPLVPNIWFPIIVRPLTNVTALRDEHKKNAVFPIKQLWNWLMNYKPMEVMVEGIVIESKLWVFPFELNILYPITVNPLNRVTAVIEIVT